MKKLWALVFSVAFAFVVAGCGDTASTTKPGDNVKPGESKTVKTEVKKETTEVKKEATPPAPAPAPPAPPAAAPAPPAPAPAK